MIRIIYTMLIVMLLFFVIGTIIQSRLNAIIEKNNLEKNKVINEQLDEEVKELENITPDPEQEKE